MQCKGHSGKICGIDWFKDDSGFSDCCQSGMVAFYDLSQQRVEMSRNKYYDFQRRGVSITSIATIPGTVMEAVAASAERKIWQTKEASGFDTKFDVSQI